MNKDDRKLLKYVNSEILKHKEDYSEEKINEIREVFREIIYIVPENANIIWDKYINLIGSDHMGIYDFESIWTIKLLIKILENSTKNKARSIFCVASLNDLYYFNLDLNKLSLEEYEIEQKKMKEILYPYSDDFYEEIMKNIEAGKYIEEKNLTV